MEKHSENPLNSAAGLTVKVKLGPHLMKREIQPLSLSFLLIVHSKGLIVRASLSGISNKFHRKKGNEY